MKIFLISVSIASIIAALLTYFSGLPFWGALLIVIGSMFINGLIAEKEDNEPGGFLNPNGDNPKWPLKVTFEDGSQEIYKNEKDIECNLEFFNSEKDTECTVTDAENKEVYLVLENLEIKDIKTQITAQKSNLTIRSSTTREHASFNGFGQLNTTRTHSTSARRAS